jgi:hypothetical protein
MNRTKKRIIVAVSLAASVAGALGVTAPRQAKMLQRIISTPVRGAAYTCTQDGKEYAVGAIICINKMPFKCVENRGWVKNGTSCSSHD